MSNNVHITALLNPVTRETAHCEIPAKGRLSDHLAIPDGVVVYRNGRGYRDGELFPGDLINIIVPPQRGESGKDIARTSIVLAAQVAAAVATSGMSVWAQVGIRGAVAIASALGANAIIPPPRIEGAINQDQEQFTRLGALTGSQNRLLPYGTVPRVYGHRKIYPPMSARPYTEIEGNRQFQRLLFCLGPGPLELSTPKIGDQEIGSFDSNNVFTPNDSFDNVEIEVGEAPELFSTSVTQTDPGATLDEDSDSAIRTTAIDTEEISLDVTFPQGLFAVDEKGRTIQHNVTFRVEYREAGESTWLNAFDEVEGTGRQIGSFIKDASSKLFRAIASKRETWRGSLSWKVTSGQYEVRLTRVETLSHNDDVNTFDSATWTALRSIDYESPTNLPGHVQIAMRIQATDQINGVLDNFSVEAKSRLAFYNGTSWDEPTFNASTGNGTGGKITSNPAWIVADILSGSANARAIGKARLDEDAFKDWADNCDTESRECNLVIDGQRTVSQTVSLVGSTGRGSLSMRDNGIYTIIQDTEQTVPVQHFTPRNSWGFTSTRMFPEVPHALRVNFVNPDEDWQTDEAVVYDDDYSEDGSGDTEVATLFESIDLEGVTDYDHAWKEGRYRLAESRLRPERYVLEADVENIVCTRGDMVLASHDVTLWGLAWGRIKSISGTELTLDEKVTMEAGESYNIRVRNRAGQSIVKSVTTEAGEQTTITVADTDDIDEGDLFMFGEESTETQELKVLEIEPGRDLKARITLVDAAPEIYDADTGTIPDFDSNITRPTQIDPRPPIPTITDIRSDGDSLYPDSDGVPVLRILIDYQVGAGRPTDLVEGRFRREEDEDGWTSFGASSSSAGTLVLKDAEPGARYIIQLRARSGEETSDWVQGPSHVAGERLKVPGVPDDAIGFITEELDGVYTEIPVELSHSARVGVDYMIVVASFPRQLISILPVAETTEEHYGPGEITLPIDEQLIVAPEGSYIKKVPDSDVRPGFDFIGESLKVVDQELQSALDIIEGTIDDVKDGLSFAKVALNAVSESGFILFSEALGDLDDIDDGGSFGKVLKQGLNASGTVLLGGVDGDLDDVVDGVAFGKVNASALTEQGLYLLSASIGDLDDVDDGTTHAKVLNTSVEAGKIVLSEVSGTLDDLEDGTSFKKVASTQITAGGIVLLSAVQGDMDDLDDGGTYGKIRLISMSDGKIVLSEVLGDMDDVEDGTAYKRIASTQVDPSGIVILSAVSGTLDDVDDGSTHAKVLATNISAGHILIKGADGSTTVINGGKFVASNVQALTAKIADFEINNDYIRKLISGTTGGYIHMTTKTWSTHRNLGFGVFFPDSEVPGGVGGIRSVHLGRLALLDDTLVDDGTNVSNDYGFEVLQKTGTGTVKHLVRMGGGDFFITNADETFVIKKTGISVRGGDTFGDEKRAFVIRDFSTNDEIGFFTAVSRQVRLASVDGADLALRADDVLRFLNIPTTAPSGTNGIYKTTISGHDVLAIT